MPTRLVRWWLLAGLLVAGVALMHTLGHPATGPGMAARPSTVRPGAALFGASLPVGPATPPVPGVAVAAPHVGAWPSLDTPGHHPHGMDPRLMCLAVLTALVAAAVVLARWRRRRTGPPAVTVTGPAGTPARGPPVPGPIGRTLAAQSVLRI